MSAHDPHHGCAGVDRPVGPILNSERDGAGVPQSKADAGIAANPQPPAMEARADDLSIESSEEALAANKLSDEVSPQMPSGQAKGRAAFGGGLGGSATDNDGALAKDALESKGELRDGSAEALAEPATPAVCVRLDQLIFVQVPADQSAEKWIASVFQQAEVQLDLSEPNSFGDLVQPNVEDKKTVSPSGDGIAMDSFF